LGGNDNDTIHGEEGNDTLYGDAGTDIIYGGSGNDILDGGAGSDVLYGGDGDDTYLINLNSGVDVVHETSGIDTIKFGAGISTSNMSYELDGNDLRILHNNVELVRLADVVGSANHVDYLEFYNSTIIDLSIEPLLSIAGTSGNDTIVATPYADTIYGYAGDDIIHAGSGEDWVVSGDGNDTIYAGEGNDFVYGGNQNEIIHGDEGNDFLLGEGGNDVIYGDDGFDVLAGGNGADTFVFEAESAYNDIDIIQDFKVLDNDKIDISDLLSGYNPLVDDINDFVTLTVSGSDMILSVDRDGAASGYSATQIASLSNVSGLNVDDLLLNNNLIAA
jgi:Ca2+-binding RTX toxin-like protein